MKKNVILVLGLCSAVMLTGCKSKESAYRQAYEQATREQAYNTDASQTTTTPAVTPVPTTPPVSEAPVTQTPTQPSSAVVVDNGDVRTIEGGFTVQSGNPLKTFSVVVSSFVTQANADNLATRLKAEGYDARVVKTNETINGTTGWYRVIAASYDDKPSAAQTRDQLRGKFPGAWLLYKK